MVRQPSPGLGMGGRVLIERLISSPWIRAFAGKERVVPVPALPPPDQAFGLLTLPTRGRDGCQS